MAENYSMCKELADDFLKLPRRAQELWFEWLRQSFLDGKDDAASFAVTYGFSTYGCNSPIEQIFMYASNVDYFMHGRDSFYEGFYLEPQFRISVGKKNYYADFLMHHDFADPKRSKSLVIECDGHEFHEKTKAQVIHDNERTMDIKIAGYDIIRFSGRQIYNDPFDCVKKAIDYFKTITVLEEGSGYNIG